MYRKHGLKRIGGTDRQKLIQKLDIAFGKMIKERDRIEPCITCPKIQKEDDDPRAWHCGHFRPRGFMATRFNPMNANKQCAYDNIYGERLSHEQSLAIAISLTGTNKSPTGAPSGAAIRPRSLTDSGSAS